MIQQFEDSITALDKKVALCGLIWLVFTIDASFTWFFSWNIRLFIGSLFALYATLLLYVNKGLVVTRERQIMFLSLLLLAVYLVFVKFFTTSILKFVPFMCVIFWRNESLMKFYDYFAKFIFFYAVLSIIVELLVISGLWKYLPYITFPPQDPIQEELGYTNYFYGLLSIQSTGFDLPFYRASGPLREGGHFSIFLGFVYFVDKVCYNKRNIWIVISGVLTLSPNFLLFVVITEVYGMIKQRHFVKPLVSLSFIVSFIIISFYATPQYIKEEIHRVVLERSLQKSLVNVETEGYFALLEGRGGDVGPRAHKKFTRSSLTSQLVGTKIPEGNVMSDYRYLEIVYGYVGTFFILGCIIVFSVLSERNLFGLCLFLLGFLVFLHRAWMFNQVYIWLIMFLILIVKRITFDPQDE